jgi:2-polyprenyl-6-methoxyphenol hydroxylase-like FAD-dependent oxidoreductase
MDIAIIGGGIAGLTTALALNRQGISATVYERADELHEVGAGIWLQPNAIQVLNELGLKELILNNAIQLDRVDVTDAQLKSFKKGGSVVQDDEGNRILSIHRAKLQQILFESLPKDSVRLAHKVRSVTRKLNKVELQFEHASVEANYVLAADGINSRIRKQLFPRSALRHSGQTCWRGISKIKLPDEFKNMGREAWGNNVRFGFSQVSDDLVYWFAVAKASPFEQDDLSAIQDKLKTMFEAFHPIVNQIITETNEEKIIRGDLMDLKRLDHWYYENICLVGDAAHATTPNMGQGAGQGIEDAYALSKLFSQNPISSNIFEKFEEIRRDKVDYVVNNSWRFGKMAHSAMGRILVKTIIKLTPEKVMSQQLEKLYSLPEIT